MTERSVRIGRHRDELFSKMDQNCSLCCSVDDCRYTIRFLQRRSGAFSAYFYAYPATGMIAVTGRKSTASVNSAESTQHVTAEFRIPWTDLPTTAEAHDELLVNVGTYPKSDSKAPSHVSSPWQIGTSPTYNPACFATIRLDEK